MNPDQLILGSLYLTDHGRPGELEVHRLEKLVSEGRGWRVVTLAQNRNGRFTMWQGRRAFARRAVPVSQFYACLQTLLSSAAGRHWLALHWPEPKELPPDTRRSSPPSTAHLFGREPHGSLSTMSWTQD